MGGVGKVGGMFRQEHDGGNEQDCDKPSSTSGGKPF